jgi:hypothetical protein
VAGTFDLIRYSQLATQFQANQSDLRINAKKKTKHTVAVAMIFSKRCSNCEILLFMRSGLEISGFDVSSFG